MSWLNWIRYWFLCFLAFSLTVLSINIVMDPLWMFSHSTEFNNYQSPYDERLQKSLYLKNSKQAYDSLMVGSSRTAYYNQSEFNNMSLFNYSISGGTVAEYPVFINYFCSTNELKNLFIGIDFFDCLQSNTDIKNQVSKNQILIKDLNRPFIFNYIKYLYNYNTFCYSLENFTNYFKNVDNGRIYDRFNNTYSFPVNINDTLKYTKKNSSNYYKKYHSYDKNFKNYLIKYNDFVNCKKIIFTTPLSIPFLIEIFNDTKLKSLYLRWVNDLVDVFDEFYFLTYPSALSECFHFYSYDGHHYNSEIGRLITQFLTNGEYSHDHISIEDNIIHFTRENSSRNIEKLIQLTFSLTNNQIL